MKYAMLKMKKRENTYTCCYYFLYQWFRKITYEANVQEATNLQNHKKR